MAQAAATQAQVTPTTLYKGIRWYDGFVVALANPGFLIGSLGYSIGALGGWGAVLLWTISMALGVAKNWIYAEMASMFPDKPGGIALYAHEGWRRYFSLAGVVATFGYWFAWSTVLSIFGLVVGSLIQSQWFPNQTWTFSDGAVNVGLPHLIAAGLIVLVWAFNIFGIRVAVWFGYVTGALLMIPLAVFIIGPFVTGNWHASNLHFGMAGTPLTLKLALVWFYVMGWSSYGVETCAAFAPEYKDTVHDTNLALKTAALFSLLVYALLPMGITGAIGEQAAVKDPVAFYVPAFAQIVGGAAGLMVLLLAASLVLSMNTATADGARALYGIARDDMTVKQLYHLNRYKVPSRAMTVDMIVNLFLVFFVGNTLAILVAGNLGYLLAHILALTAFLLLRKDRPHWPRPIRASNVWIPIAVLLAAANLVFVIYGVLNPDITGYGTFFDLLVGIGVLLISVLLYIFRRVFQDGKPIALREETPVLPPAGANLA